MSLSHRSFRLALLAAILLIAALLRANYIRQPLIDAFSWRQASTAMIADNYYRGNANIFYPEVSWSGDGPNYQGREFQTVTYLAALLYRLVGQQDWVGRGIAVAFGVWGVFALYQLVRRVWGEPHALAAAGLMAVLPGSIFVDRSFLPDPAMVSLVVTSFWLLVLYLQTGRLRWLVLAGLIGTWGLLTKITGMIVGLPMLYASITILRGRGQLNRHTVVPLILVAVLSLIPVAAYYLWARHLSLTYPPYHFAGASNWLWSSRFSTWWANHYFVPELGDHLTAWLWTLPVLILVVVGVLVPPPGRSSALIRRHSGSQAELAATAPWAPWTFHWWAVAGLVFYALGAQELVHNPWNLHLVNPAAAALGGNALVVLASQAKRYAGPIGSGAAIILVLGIVVAYGQRNMQYMYLPYAAKAHAMGMMLRQLSQPGDLVVTIAEAVGDPVAIYYSQRHGWTYPLAHPERDWSQLPATDAEARQLYEELRAQGADWLGIVSDHRHTIWADYPGLVEQIEQSAELVQETPEWVIYRIRGPL